MAKFLLVHIVLALFQWSALHFSQSHASSIAIDKDRSQLLKDAVGWMTFRQKGQLMSDQQLAPLFLNPLLEKYAKSKFYRTFVIAFQKGVLPRLTLQENQACDPSYTKEYKDPRNNSVTWHYQKQFTFGMYAKRDSSKLQLCDYRQGLVCSPQTSKCQCPEGTSMSPIDQSSSVKRCLLKQDEICALADLDHGNDLGQNPVLSGNLYHLAFNLEKPPSCQVGSQCRFLDGYQDYPRCYAVNNGPFIPPPRTDSVVISFHRALGTECAIGLLAEAGSCKHNGGVEGFKQLTCYNYGPPRSTPNTVDTGRKGFCGPYYGPYGISLYDDTKPGDSYHPLFIPYVYPRTVPLRYELEKYYRKFVWDVYAFMDLRGNGNYFIMVRNEGDKCSVAKTEQFEKAWQYFASLEGAPAPGSDYVAGATKAELDNHLQTVADFSSTGQAKVCKIFFHYDRPKHDPTTLESKESLKCVKEGSPDADGNDGKCQKHNSLDTITKPFAKKFQDFLDTINQINSELDNQEKNYKEEILKENPEPPCTPQLIVLPEARSAIVDTLEGGYCPDGSVCYEDFSDARRIYDGDCNLLDNAQQRFVCHDLNQPLDRCEGKYLRNKVEQVVKYLDKFGKRVKGQKCFPEFEKLVRGNDISALLGKFNQYQVLGWLNSGVLCDAKKGGDLGCTNEGICECVGDNCVGVVSPITQEPAGNGTEETGEETSGGEQGKAMKLMIILLVLITIISWN